MPTATTSTVSILPRDKPRTVTIMTFARHVGYYMGSNRHGNDKGDLFNNRMDKYQASTPTDGATREMMIDEIEDAIYADQVYDSEEAQAQRAVYSTFKRHYGDGGIIITGWISGETVHPPGVFSAGTLTGRPCPRCEVNPVCDGHAGSGVRCLDEQKCGWLYCAS